MLIPSSSAIKGEYIFLKYFSFDFKLDVMTQNALLHAASPNIAVPSNNFQTALPYIPSGN